MANDGDSLVLAAPPCCMIVLVQPRTVAGTGLFTYAPFHAPSFLVLPRPSFSFLPFLALPRPSSPFLALPRPSSPFLALPFVVFASLKLSFTCMIGGYCIAT